MILRKIEPDDITSFQNEVEKSRNLVERTLYLTWSYVQARFKIPEKEFKNIYSIDSSNDGGIDCYFQEGASNGFMPIGPGKCSAFMRCA